MPAQQTVLLVGGTGRTGGRVLEQLLGRGVRVRAIVRSAARLPSPVAGDPGLTVLEADLLSLSNEDLEGHVRGCHAVISCLGHVIAVKGILGSRRCPLELPAELLTPGAMSRRVHPASSAVA